MSSTASVVAEKHRDYTGAKIGMWLFLFTELLLFGGMFLLYAVYRAKHPTEFHNAATELNTLIGTINTLILLSSSLTMVLSIAATQRGNKRLAIFFLALTILCGLVFLVNKYFEWTAKIHHGIYPNSAELEKFAQGEILFFGLYYAMTGLHGLHVLVGVIVLGVMLRFLVRQPREVAQFEPKHLTALGTARLALLDSEGNRIWESEILAEQVESVEVAIQFKPEPKRFRPETFVNLENAGLYWHLVDVIWIFLFPLFYLIT